MEALKNGALLALSRILLINSQMLHEKNHQKTSRNISYDVFRGFLWIKLYGQSYQTFQEIHR